jgi:hypothetical protein
VIEGAQVGRLECILIATVGRRAKDNGCVAASKTSGLVFVIGTVVDIVVAGLLLVIGIVVNSLLLVITGTYVGGDIFNSSQDLFLAQVVYAETQGVDAPVEVILVIASAAISRGIPNFTWGKCTGFVGTERVAANGGDLASKLSSDLLVEFLGPIGSSVLMLLKGGNLRVDSNNRLAEDRLQAHRSSIALQCSENESVNHAIDIALLLGIGEGLIGSGLLKAVWIEVSDSSF